ncbi:glycosyltransferase family protein [Uliginosibacterium sp. H1]|uniref:glycosyltransferase family protein n=1 Tax=Uliginosibacterium sp. H1 TaxID=3114757 RepID=UPI002E171C47|nr:glycosyltransferase family 1 protein [Uliginosibacterium sp. H1]
MEIGSSLPDNAVGRFAVVKLWPGIKTAEDECIARLKIAAGAIGVECVEVNADGSFIDGSGKRVSKDIVDFVVHLHYDTPKAYDAFSFVALWNPPRFYHEWGYARCSRNLTTHDDFLSCSSAPADDHVRRMVRNKSTHLPPLFNLYHSTAGIVEQPSLGEGKLFYAGINWEAINGGKSRHQEVLKRLDRTGLLRIYGPEIFQGVRVWAGYDSYVKEVPFDGVSMVREIAKTGIALVLSSQAHKDAELMSNRLFESIAAGALVICDENPFAQKFFGDTLLYIDGQAPVDDIVDAVCRHIAWANENPAAAIGLAQKAQDIFCRQFTLIRSLSDLYRGLADRKRALAALQGFASSELRVTAYFLMPEYSEERLQAHIQSINSQEYKNFLPVLVVNRESEEEWQPALDRAIQASAVRIQVMPVSFFERVPASGRQKRRRVGQVILDALATEPSRDAFVFVAPNERLFSGHIATLAGVLQRDSSIAVAATAALLSSDRPSIHEVHELLDFGHVNRAGPTGYGRFIFRGSVVRGDIDLALPYLDGRPLAVLVGRETIFQHAAASITIDIRQEYPERTWDDEAESAVIRDYCGGLPAIAPGFNARLSSAEIQMVAASAASAGMSKAQFVKRLFNYRWVRVQLNAVRQQGLSARLGVLRRKLVL